MVREIGVRTKAIIVALLVCLSAPQLGCASVAKQGCGSTERAATAVKNKDKKKPNEEKAAQISGAKTEEKKEPDGKDQESDDSKKEDSKSSNSSKSDNKGDSSQSKQNSGNSQNSGSNSSSSNGGSQKKWVPEQGHWETDYGQVWVPNVVYVRHGRFICNACGATFDSKTASTHIAMQCMPKARTMMVIPMTPTPPARTRGITSSRRPGSTGSSTWPDIGSNVHRSSPLTFGK